MRFKTAFAGLLATVYACAAGDQTAPGDPDLASATAVVASVVINPANDTIASLGGTAQLSAIVKDRNGLVLSPGVAPVQWKSLNPLRATISPTGKVTSLKTGQASITATSGTRVDTALITMMAAPLRKPSAAASTISATPTSIAATSGSAIITVVVVDSLGVPLPNATVTLSAAGTGHTITTPAPTDAGGRTTAKFSATTIGSRIITASANGVVLSNKATIAVRNPLEAVTTIMSCVIPPVPPSGTVNLVTDVVYDSPGGVAQKLDVAWPKTAGVHPLVLVVHGGGWTQGDKSTFRSAILTLASQGYTAIAVNYRLVSGASNIFPTSAQDLRCALRWIRANAARYNLDPNRAAVAGVSAGAHLAQLLGLAPEATKLDGPCSVTGPMATVVALVSYEGPSDMRRSSLFTSTSLPAITGLLGGAPETVPQRAALASPVTYSTAGDPPTLIIHGTLDTTVPASHATALKSSLNLAGVPATYIPVPGIGHSLQLFSATSPQVSASCTTVEFLRQELQP